jgi:hypothetical protein
MSSPLPVTRPSAHAEPSERAARIGPWLLWFAVLGGAVAWSVHLVVGWGMVETACAADARTLLGIPLRAWVVVATVVPGLVAVAATAVSVVLWRRLAGTEESGSRSLARTRLMVLIGLVSNVLHVMIFLLDGVAVAVFSACVR